MKKKLFALLLALALILSLSASVFAYTVPSDTVVYVTETGSCYHRWGCASLKSVAASYTVAYAVDLGYYGCSHCHASTLTGTHTPVSSTSSGSSGSASSGPDISQYLAKAEALDNSRAESDDSNGKFFSDPVKVAAVVLLGVFLLPIILGTLHSLFACSISVFRKKTPVDTTDEDGKPLPF